MWDVMLCFSEEPITFILKFEEQGKRETSTEQATLAAHFLLVSCLAYYLNLKVEAQSTFERSEKFY
jgi:hypothetical protein